MRCRGPPSRRTTCAPTSRASCGTRISSSLISAGSTRAPASIANSATSCPSRTRAPGRHGDCRDGLPKPNAPAGALALEPDQDGNWWLSMMFQAGLVRFDPRTQQFRHFPIPSDLMSDATQQSLVMPARAKVDGKVWTNDVDTRTIMRLDLATGAYERIAPFRGLPT